MEERGGEKGTERQKERGSKWVHFVFGKLKNGDRNAWPDQCSMFQINMRQMTRRKIYSDYIIINTIALFLKDTNKQHYMTHISTLSCPTLM